MKRVKVEDDSVSFGEYMALRWRQLQEQSTYTEQLPQCEERGEALLLLWTLFVLFPFSRLVHIWSAPVEYLTRKYQIVRARR